MSCVGVAKIGPPLVSMLSSKAALFNFWSWRCSGKANVGRGSDGNLHMTAGRCVMRQIGSDTTQFSATSNDERRDSVAEWAAEVVAERFPGASLVTTVD